HAVVERVLADAFRGQDRFGWHTLARRGRQGKQKPERKRGQHRSQTLRTDETWRHVFGSPSWAGRGKIAKLPEQGRSWWTWRWRQERAKARRGGGQARRTSRSCTLMRAWPWSTNRRACSCTTAAWRRANATSWWIGCACSSGAGCFLRTGWTAPPAAACCWRSTAPRPRHWAGS